MTRVNFVAPYLTGEDPARGRVSCACGCVLFTIMVHPPKPAPIVTFACDSCGRCYDLAELKDAPHRVGR